MSSNTFINNNNNNNDVQFNTEIISLNNSNQTFEQEQINYFSSNFDTDNSPKLNPCKISEQFYQLHVLKQQQLQQKNEETFSSQQNYKENLFKNQEYQQKNNIQHLNSREQYDIANYEPPQYESWEEEEDLDIVIDLNRSNSFNSGIFQFETNNNDYLLNNQLQSWKL
ncbi:hypothetical protein HANVADRAFT_51251 [Hanseniaspora valbyensis NRRL Y-1626]|uniref:Uncharacterized protein n=1 Tax=Hanseniaspora valbyensis NRRL Y-1626 TaxID=766949 RepID=A0A1B7TJ79_9ASCO|nr:hypothetical protein HANVADRAFT_51251 [Hanseniaspora valbyensis NRRL Y-1626]